MKKYKDIMDKRVTCESRPVIVEDGSVETINMYYVTIYEEKVSIPYELIDSVNNATSDEQICSIVYKKNSGTRRIYVLVSSDYRTGRKIKISSNKKKTKKYLSHIDLHGTYRIKCYENKNTKYIYNIYVLLFEQYDKYEQIYIKSVKRAKKAKKILNHLFSEANGSLPFVATGMTDGYEEEGYYPDPLPDKGLLKLEIDKIQSQNYYAVCAVVIKNKSICAYNQIYPLF